MTQPIVISQRCPKCGAQMRHRVSQYGPFFGCSRYPDCRAIVSLKDAGAMIGFDERTDSPPPAQKRQPPATSQPRKRAGKPMVERDEHREWRLEMIASDTSDVPPWVECDDSVDREFMAMFAG